MLDLKIIRDDPERVKAQLNGRLRDSDLIGTVVGLDERLRREQTELEALKAEQNRLTRAIGRPAVGDDVATLKVKARALGDQISGREASLRERQQELRELLLQIPNLPDDSVPPGEDSGTNVVVRSWGRPPAFAFTPRPHWEVGAALGLDLVRGARAAGSGFSFLTGPAARLELALITFMMDLHSRNHGYVPAIVPYLVGQGAMVGCGQLPKFGDQLYRAERDDLYLIPTAESALAALHQDEILDGAALPLKYVGFSPCFRREAGAAGVDTRGILRVHQFHKVELFKYTAPEQSAAELEALVQDAEAVLQALGLAYRVVLLSAGDMGFAAARTYDLEVWLPGQPDGAGALGVYREISSCSNVKDFQARRANIRYRPAPGARPAYVHMLNGSGLAVGRTLVAILETYQQPDGSVLVPPALQPHLGQDRLMPGRP